MSTCEALGEGVCGHRTGVMGSGSSYLTVRPACDSGQVMPSLGFTHSFLVSS
jgi:hypothetical protein